MYPTLFMKRKLQLRVGRVGSFTSIFRVFYHFLKEVTILILIAKNKEKFLVLITPAKSQD